MSLREASAVDPAPVRNRQQVRKICRAGKGQIAAAVRHNSLGEYGPSNAYACELLVYLITARRPEPLWCDHKHIARAMEVALQRPYPERGTDGRVRCCLELANLTSYERSISRNIRSKCRLVGAHGAPAAILACALQSSSRAAQRGPLKGSPTS